MASRFGSLTLGLATLATVLGLCTPSIAQTTPPPFTLSSPKLTDGAVIDRRFAGDGACGGENVSLPLTWSNAPANTKSFAVILFDMDGGNSGGVIHWIFYGIAPESTGLPEGEGTAATPHAVAGTASNGGHGYRGPCAPATDNPHHYIYTLYALDIPKDELPAGLTRDQFLEKAKGHILKTMSLIALYKRP